MMPSSRSDHPEFDEYAADYDAALARGLSISGESKDYFARRRVMWLAGCLQRLQLQPKSIMDFGCGTGSTMPLLIELIGAESVLGIDVSAKLLDVAKQHCNTTQAQFQLLDEFQPSGQIDVVYCNGVFHHIPPRERPAIVNYVHHSLRPGGIFAFWENNPWNPGTRYVMSRIPFDGNAVTLAPLEARRLLRAGGFEVLRIDFLFIFPRSLRWFRSLEPLICQLPFGAQYQVLCRKPFSHPAHS